MRIILSLTAAIVSFLLVASCNDNHDNNQDQAKSEPAQSFSEDDLKAY